MNATKVLIPQGLLLGLARTVKIEGEWRGDSRLSPDLADLGRDGLRGKAPLQARTVSLFRICDSHSKAFLSVGPAGGA